jgi:hypothetical protein
VDYTQGVQYYKYKWLLFGTQLRMLVMEGLWRVKGGDEQTYCMAMRFYEATKKEHICHGPDVVVANYISSMKRDNKKFPSERIQGVQEIL